MNMVFCASGEQNEQEIKKMVAQDNACASV